MALSATDKKFMICSSLSRRFSQQQIALFKKIPTSFFPGLFFAVVSWSRGLALLRRRTVEKTEDDQKSDSLKPIIKKFVSFSASVSSILAPTASEIASEPDPYKMAFMIKKKRYKFQVTVASIYAFRAKMLDKRWSLLSAFVIIPLLLLNVPTIGCTFTSSWVYEGSSLVTASWINP